MGVIGWLRGLSRCPTRAAPSPPPGREPRVELPPPAPGPCWPALAGFDYRYGFPLDPHALELLEGLDAGRRAFVLARLEADTFAALVRLDLETLG